MKHNLKPFFCYYGGKWRAAKHYPAPTTNKIIEPFAGAAGYSTRYYERNIVLYETDPVVFSVWNYLITVKSNEIMELPEIVEHVDQLNVCQEAKWLIGFWLNKGTIQPKKSPSKWMKQGLAPNSWWGKALKERLASQVMLIKHWKIHNQSYEQAENGNFTYFVDPPYQGEAGKKYKQRFSDFEKLAVWCQNLQGQVIVCEQEGANWLPFKPFMTIKSTPGQRGKAKSKEVIWLKNGVV